MSDDVKINVDNGSTGVLAFNEREVDRSYRVGIRERGERREVAYFGKSPRVLPIDCTLDGDEMQAIEALDARPGWTVLTLAKR